MSENQNKEITNNENKKSVWAWVWMGFSLLYTILPFDIIPDIPFIGWIDDLFVLLVAGLNLTEKNFTDAHSQLKSILKITKWVIVGIGIVTILTIVLFGTAIYQLATS